MELLAFLKRKNRRGRVLGSSLLFLHTKFLDELQKDSSLLMAGQLINFSKQKEPQS